MQLLSKINKAISFLLWFIDNKSKYATVISIKDKNGITKTNGFPKILDESGCKPNKI